MTEREKIAARIRALRAKTVANGCTEDEAISAAAKVAEMLERYNMTVDEAEMRASPFERREEAHDDVVGDRCLWKIASAVTVLTGTTYWRSPPGVFPVKVTFFGFAHEVEIASFMTDLCANALRCEQGRILRGGKRAYTARQRSRLYPYLDGMTDRLCARLRALVPPQQTGAGLVVLRNELLKAALEDEGVGLRDGRAAASRSHWDSYRDGQEAGDRVALNAGVSGPKAARQMIS